VSDTQVQYETMTVEEPTAGVLVATLNRPDRLNSMTPTMFDEFERMALGLRDADLRALIMTGAGRAFCAGFDLDMADELSGLSPLAMLGRQERAARSLAAIRSLPMPVIAAVNGAAAGGGLALALAADIRIGSPAARFNAAFVRIGLSAGDLGTSWLLPRLIGPARAAEFAYTGRFIESEEAEQIGLLNRVVPAESLLDEALALAGQIAANSPAGVQLSKRALQANMEAASFAAALELENRGQALLTRGEDMPEALQAFKERRDPRFTGR
jgi:enoyl-CoA hydratase/carnithine racemase